MHSIAVRNKDGEFRNSENLFLVFFFSFVSVRLLCVFASAYLVCLRVQRCKRILSSCGAHSERYNGELCRSSRSGKIGSVLFLHKMVI